MWPEYETTESLIYLDSKGQQDVLEADACFSDYAEQKLGRSPLSWTGLGQKSSDSLEGVAFVRVSGNSKDLALDEGEVCEDLCLQIPTGGSNSSAPSD